MRDCKFQSTWGLIFKRCSLTKYRDNILLKIFKISTTTHDVHIRTLGMMVSTSILLILNIKQYTLSAVYYTNWLHQIFHHHNFHARKHWQNA